MALRPSLFPSRPLLLALLGSGMALLYLVNFTLPLNLFTYYDAPLLDLGKITGYTPEWAYRFTGTLLLLFALYTAAIFVARGSIGRTGKLLIIAFALTFHLLLFLTYPVGAADVFDYLLHARVLTVHGGNPLTQAPAAYPGDPYLPYSAWPYLQSTYGPLWAYISAPIGPLSQLGLLSALFGLKGVAILFSLGTVILLHRTLLLLNAPHPWAGTLLYLWNPLAAFEFAANAHNDALLVFLLIFAFFVLAHTAIGSSFPALAASALTKFVTLPLFLPFALHLWRQPWPPARRFGVGVTAAGLTILLATALYLPLWDGPGSLSVLQRGGLFTTSPAALLARGLEGNLGWEQASRIAGRFSLAAFAVGLLAASWLARRDTPSLLRSCYEVLFLVLLLGVTWFKPWYVIWLLVVAPLTLDLRREMRAVLFALSAMLSYTVFIYLWPLNASSLSSFQVELMAVTTVFLPVLLFIALAHGPLRRGRAALAG